MIIIVSHSFFSCQFHLFVKKKSILKMRTITKTCHDCLPILENELTNPCIPQDQPMKQDWGKSNNCTFDPRSMWEDNECLALMFSNQLHQKLWIILCTLHNCVSSISKWPSVLQTSVLSMIFCLLHFINMFPFKWTKIDFFQFLKNFNMFVSSNSLCCEICSFEWWWKEVCVIGKNKNSSLKNRKLEN